MAKLVNHCPVCNLKAIEKTSMKVPGLDLDIIGLECGHSYTKAIEKTKPWQDIETLFGRKGKLYPYQGEGYEFARESGFRVLIGDEPGLGKTWQADTCLKLHPEILLPALIICKSALKIQQMRELLRICGPDYLPQIIGSSKDKITGTFNVTIVTYDLLWRIAKKDIDRAETAEKEARARLNLDEWDILPEEERNKIPEIKNPFLEAGFKCVILDECQQIKNPESKRAQQVREIASKIPHVIATSGSAIENHAGEYFTILNILRPERFPSYKHYVWDYCDYYQGAYGTKVGGIRNLESFKEKTKDFIIRRKQADVLPDLPKLNRKFIECEFSNEKIARQYEQALEDFKDTFEKYEGKADFQQQILAKMAILRHLTGLNKVAFVSEFMLDFLMDTNRKITTFVHHQDVGQMLSAMVSKEIAVWKQEVGSFIEFPLMFTSDLNTNQRSNILDRFEKEDGCRSLIGSTLAMSEGLNLQFCSDCIIMERQWNPMKEEQAERRFIRPEGAKVSTVNANYIIVVGTIDEYFTELVEEKRANVSNTLDGTTLDFKESSLIRELGETLMRKGNKKWKLK